MLAIYLLLFKDRQETSNRNDNNKNAGMSTLLSSENANSGQPAAGNHIEVLRYAIEVENVAGRTATVDLASGKWFKLHFTPQTNGFLYLISPYVKDESKLFVEVQSLQANLDSAIPKGNQWIPSSKVKTIIAVFAEKPISELTLPLKSDPVLTKEAFNELRRASATTKIVPSATDNKITISEGRGEQPIIFDITFKR